MPINAGELPHPIEHDAIREAAERHERAQAAVREAQRAVAKFDERQREIAKLQDAQDADAAIAAGKPVPKTRRHVAEFDKAREEAEHNARVAGQTVIRTARELQAALDQHGDEWRDQLQRQSDAADQSWQVAVETLIELHQERVQAHRKLRAFGGSPSAPTGPALLDPARLADSVTGERLSQAVGQLVLTPQARHEQRVVVQADVMLDALAKMGNPDPIPEFRPGGYVADLFKQAHEHAESVARGYAPGEENAPAVRDGPRYRQSAPDFEFEEVG